MKILAVVCVCVVIFHLASAQTKICSPGSYVNNGTCTACQQGHFQPYNNTITDVVTCKQRTNCNASKGGYKIKEGSPSEDNHCWCNESMGYGPRNPKACNDPKNMNSANCVCIKCPNEECVVTKDENGDYLERYNCTVCDSVTMAVPPISTPSLVSSGLVVGITVPIVIVVILCIVCRIYLYVRGVPQWLQEFCDPICGRCCQCWASVSSNSEGGRPSYGRQPSSVELLCGVANGDISDLFLIKLRELCSDNHTKSHFFNTLVDVGASWKFLVRPELGETDIQALEYEYRPYLKEIIYQAVRQWYEKVSGKSVQFVLDRLEMENVGKGDLADKIRKDSVLMRKLEEIYAQKSPEKGRRTVTSNGSQVTGDLSVNDRNDDRGIPSVPPPDVNPSSCPSRAAGVMIEYENSPRPGYKSSHPSINEVKIGEEGKGDGIGDMIEYENSPRPGSRSLHSSMNEVKTGEEGKGDGIVSS